MKKLFSEAKLVDDQRSMSLTDLPGEGVVIIGNTLMPDNKLEYGTLRLSDEAFEILRQMANKRHELLEKGPEEAE